MIAFTYQLFILGSTLSSHIRADHHTRLSEQALSMTHVHILTSLPIPQVEKA